MEKTLGTKTRKGRFNAEVIQESGHLEDVDVLRCRPLVRRRHLPIPPEGGVRRSLGRLAVNKSRPKLHVRSSVVDAAHHGFKMRCLGARGHEGDDLAQLLRHGLLVFLVREPLGRTLQLASQPSVM